ncbi:amidase [Neobacillus sp. GCM10023253]|uniref:amidase n=1 Tax=Neobacillus sp. GCM10023253 TaxID=3252644 RepID=UPI0036176B24
MDILSTSILLKNKEVSPVDLVKNTLEKIAKENPKTNAFITVSEEESLQAAKKLEDEIMAGEIRSPLHGIPIAVKDLIFTKGIRTTMGSKVYEDFVPDADATVVQKLKDAGAIIIGKTNTHEFAYGPIGDRSYFGPCRNPHNLDKITGGSSSGSGAAVASGMVLGALGTDTGGSIRIPAAACGIVGMKPTFGLVSKKGAFPLAYTLDHIGPMTTNVRDNAIMLNVLAGYDAVDPYSLHTESRDYSSLIGHDVKGKVIGIPSNYFGWMDEEVHAAVVNCIHVYEQAGAVIKKVEIPNLSKVAKAQLVTIQSEAAAVHVDTLKHHKEDIDDEVFERLVASQAVKGYEYVQSQIERMQIVAEFNQVFDQVDILLTPTLPILPTNIGQREVQIQGQTEAVRYALLRLTSPTNYTGNPSLSIPCGMSSSKLPIGVQLIGKHGHDAELYQLGYALEQILNKGHFSMTVS